MVPADHDHRGPGVGQAEGNGAAESFGATGHDCHALAEIEELRHIGVHR
jgi:hypothetical protein